MKVMKINLKARLKNKAFLVSVIALLVSFVYHILAFFGITPAHGENEILELLGMAINILAVLGVIVDPTTEGLSDSERALTYCTECDVRKKLQEEKEREEDDENE